MPFLSGSLGFERFSVSGFTDTFGDEQLAALVNHSAGNFQTSATENVHVGFLGGDHLFDQQFDLGKNLINDSLHCCVRVDTNQVPAAIRKAWLQIELAALTKDNTTRRPTKAQRVEAKEAVEQRCSVEAATGKYRKMSQFPVLWDLRNELFYFGGSGSASLGHCASLFERALNIELSRITAGSIAMDWARRSDLVAEVSDLVPTSFIGSQLGDVLSWTNVDSSHPDFLGNEFLLWLWWKSETETDTISVADDSEVTFMLNKTLSLECPWGENGKESISSDAPTKLPEALRALQSGKLPRKSGMSLIRDGQQFDFVLQAESFAVSGAKIHADEDEAHDLDCRIDAIRMLGDTIDLLYGAFLSCRAAENWNNDTARIREWLHATESKFASSAA